MKKINWKKLFVKNVVVGGAFTIALGALVKLNYAVDEKLDKKYDQKETEETS